MARLQASLVLVLIAVSMVATRLAAAPPAGPCFTSGSVTYQVTASSVADYRVRIDSQATQPDLRIQLVDDATNADLVLVDDIDAMDRDVCRAAGAFKTVSVVGPDSAPALTVSLSRAEEADFRLFVRSARFGQHDAAALFAAMWDAKRKQDVAEIR